jgi:hypothetical protein
MVRMDARAEQISNNNALIPLPYAPPDQPHDDLTPVVMAKFWSLRNSEGHKISPHEIHTLDVPDAPILHAYVCCQCANGVWPDLACVLKIDTLLISSIIARLDPLYPAHQYGYRLFPDHTPSRLGDRLC